MDGTDGGQMRDCRLLTKLLADLGRTPAGILALEADDDCLDLSREPVRLAEGPAAAVSERFEAAIFVAVEDLVAGLAGDAELGAQRRHLLALEQAGDKSEPLVHEVTLLPRHALLLRRGQEVSPMCPEYSVTSQEGQTRTSEMCPLHCRASERRAIMKSSTLRAPERVGSSQCRG